MKQCRFCGGNLELFLDLSEYNLSLTSDFRRVNIPVIIYQCNNCKLVQKIATKESQEKLFQKFSSHSLTNGQEQVKFINGKPIPRSEVLLKNISKNITDYGELLDIGTGNGSFLKAFKKFFQNWELYGQDIQDNSKDDILSIIKAENFFINNIKNINKKFDMISLIHVLGHIPNIKEFIHDIQKLLKQNSNIFIQTPNLQTHPFDLIVIDQINHFDKYSLSYLLKDLNLNTTFKDIITTELSVIMEKSPIDKNTHINYNGLIKKFKALLEFVKNTDHPLYILGTTHAGSFCGLILKDNLIAYIDEDITKIGKTHNGKKILSFSSIENKNYKVLLPFFDMNISNHIKDRYKDINFITIDDLKS